MIDMGIFSLIAALLFPIPSGEFVPPLSTEALAMGGITSQFQGPHSEVTTPLKAFSLGLKNTGVGPQLPLDKLEELFEARRGEFQKALREAQKESGFSSQRLNAGFKYFLDLLLVLATKDPLKSVEILEGYPEDRKPWIYLKMPGPLYWRVLFEDQNPRILMHWLINKPSGPGRWSFERYVSFVLGADARMLVPLKDLHLDVYFVFRSVVDRQNYRIKLLPHFRLGSLWPAGMTSQEIRKNFRSYFYRPTAKFWRAEQALKSQA